MVEYLTIREKEYPVRLGYYVMKTIQSKHGVTLDEALQGAEKPEDVKALAVHEDILYAALQMGAYADHGSMDKLDLTEEDMPMVLDMVFPKYFKLFSSPTFFPSDLKDDGEDAEGNDPEKKKETPKRTKKKK